MSTAEIAHAFLTPVDTIKKRISRAKALVKAQKIPFETPSKTQLQQRIAAVLQVIYLVFNEGYSSSCGNEHIRKELTAEAILLGRKLAELVATPESVGLLSLLLLQESRREARVAANGDLIPLEAQDRSLWDKKLIHEGVQLLQTVIMTGRLGPYTLQAAIASVHSLAGSLQDTQWDLILEYYDMLLSIHPSPVVELNRAIALGMHAGPKAGLARIEQLMHDKKLRTYHLIHAVRADFCKKLGRKDEAIQAYQQALSLARQEPEKRYLNKQLSQL